MNGRVLCGLGAVLWLCVHLLAQPQTSRKKTVAYDAAVKAAIEKNDISICKTITDSWQKLGRIFDPYLSQRQCRIEFAVAKEDPSVCSELSKFEKGPRLDTETSLDIEGDCLTHLAWALRRLDLCEQIMPHEKTEKIQLYWRESCRASATYDVKQCSEGVHQSQYYFLDLRTQEACLTQIARNRGDEAVCRGIDSETGRQTCIALVKRQVDQGAQYPTGPVRSK
jgi:hypothetical protein